MIKSTTDETEITGGVRFSCHLNRIDGNEGNTRYAGGQLVLVFGDVGGRNWSISHPSVHPQGVDVIPTTKKYQPLPTLADKHAAQDCPGSSRPSRP